MKKLQKGLIVVLACLFSLVLGLVACGGEDPGSDPVTHSVTILGADELTVGVIEVSLLNDDDSVAQGPKKLTVTEQGGAYVGTATFTVAVGTYKVKVDKLPDSYTVPEAAVTPTDPHTVLTLRSSGTGPVVGQDITYKLTLNDESGVPVEGVVLQLCSTGAGAQCYLLEATNARGEASIELKEGEYEVHIPDVPAGKYFDNNYYLVDKDNNDITVSFETKYDHKVTILDEAGEPKAGVEVTLNRQYFQSYGKYYAGTAKATTGADGVATINTPLGTYSVTLGGSGEGYGFESYVIDLEGNLSPSGTYGDTFNISSYSYKDSTTNETVLDGVENTLKLVKEGKVAGAPKKITVGTQNVTVTADQNEFWYHFLPEVGGIYKVESAGSLDTDISLYGKGAYYPFAGKDYITFYGKEPEGDGYDYKADKTESDKNFSFSFKIDPEEMDERNWNVLKIVVPADSTGSFSFTVTLVREIKPPERVTVTVEAEQAEKQTEVPDGILTRLDEETVGDVTYDEKTNRYRINGNGPVIYALINSSDVLPLGFTANFYMASLEGPQSFAISDGKADKDNKIYTYEYFSKFIPTYKENCNSAGMHPLTKELHDFLVMYDYKNFGGDNSEDSYYYACVYYEQYKTPTGDNTSGTADNPYQLAGPGTYRFTVPAGAAVCYTFVRGKVEMSATYEIKIVSGNVKLLAAADGEAVKSVELVYGTKFFIKNEGSAEVTVTADITRAADKGPFEDVGEYYVYGKYDGGDDYGTEYVFVAPKDGSYTFTADSSNAFIVYLIESADGGESSVQLNSMKPEVIELTEGQRFTFYASVGMGQPNTYYTLTIAEASDTPGPSDGLIVGNNTLAANGDGISYEFTAPESGTYRIYSTDANAYLSIEIGGTTELLTDKTITLTLSEGQKIALICSTDDWQDDTYIVTIEKVE